MTQTDLTEELLLERREAPPVGGSGAPLARSDARNRSICMREAYRNYGARKSDYMLTYACLQCNHLRAPRIWRLHDHPVRTDRPVHRRR